MVSKYAQIHNDKGGHFKDPPANKALDEDWDGDREDREADGELGRKKNSAASDEWHQKRVNFSVASNGNGTQLTPICHFTWLKRFHLVEKGQCGEQLCSRKAPGWINFKVWMVT